MPLLFDSSSLLVSGIFDSLWVDLNELVASVALDLIAGIIGIIQNAPEPDFLSSSGWFVEQYGIMLQLGLFLVVPFLLVSVITALIKGGISALLKVFLVGLPVSVLGSLAALAVVALLLQINNSMVDALLAKLDSDFRAFYAGLESSTGAVDPSPGNLMINIIVMFVMVLGAIAVYLELIFRCVALYMSVIFLPMAFAAWSWEPARAWFSRLANITFGLIFSEFVVVAVLTMAFASIRYAFAVDPTGADSETVQLQLGAFISGAVAFFFAAISGPAVVALIIGADGAPAMSRKEFGGYTPVSADQRFTRGEYGHLVPGYQKFKKHRIATGRQ